MFAKTFLIFCLALGVSCAPSGSIVDLAVATPDLSTLVTALKAANLVDTLSGDGPFTVFAPTNEAFAKIPTDTLNHLLDPANVEELTALLTYHVVSGDIHAKDLKPFQEVPSVEGADLRITDFFGHVYVDYAQVTAADNDATNGVVHIIDHVLFPPRPKPVVVKLASLGKSGAYTGDVDIVGSAELSFVGTGVTISYDLTGVETECATAGSAANSCGIHIHAGFSCEDATAQGGHYHTGDVDPWGSAVYVAKGASAKGSLKVEFGYTAEEAMGRVLIAHDYSGARVTCIPIQSGAAPTPAPKQPSIVDLAIATPDLSTLVTALKAANLVDTLSGDGPFTVFAPTNEAFKELPASTLAHLLDPANIKELQAILTYHVVAGDVHAKDLKSYQEVATVEGEDVRITKHHDRVYVNRARVTAADNDASNGVVHIIDKVLIPPPTPAAPTPAPKPASNIVELAVATQDLSTLVTALTAANLTGVLSGDGPFTVFAPTNEAFAKLPKSTLNYLLDPKNIKQLVAVLTYHVVSGDIRSKDLQYFQDVKTLEGSEVRIVDFFGQVIVNNAKVTTADVGATNGVIHIIDEVLIPYKSNAATISLY